MFRALIQNAKFLHNIKVCSFLTELFSIEGVYPRIVPHFQVFSTCLLVKLHISFFHHFSCTEILEMNSALEREDYA